MGAQFVVDASIVMSWCFADEADAYADGVLDRLAQDEALVPSIWPLEIGNVLLVAERRKRLSEADSARFLALLAELPIVVEPEPPQRMLREILGLARELGLSTYDAAYLDLAMRLGLPIATNDAALRKAAKRVRVPLLAQAK
ncbi:MAG: type II toxin-antitoxin system VapC family toxin [Thermodesulfobacteriota bacterium]